MPGSVVVVGSINADLVVTVDRLPAAGETVIGGRFARHGGGKGANQAVAAARAGARVRFVGAVGDDDFGAAALEELQSEGVDVSAVASGANARVDGARIGALAAGDVCLLGFEVPDAAVAAGASAAAEAGARIVLNPAPARALPEALHGGGAVLTPNAGEAEALGGAREIAARTGGPVIVTLGADGALLLDGGNETAIPAPAVDVVDTTGAGDAFNGVLAAGLAAGLELEAAARRAVEAATASVRVAGARG